MELWVADIDGSNKTKLSTAASLATGTWGQDNLHLNFTVEEAGKTTKAYIVNADGSGLHALTWTGGTIQGVLWSDDQKSVYINSFEKVSRAEAFGRRAPKDRTRKKWLTVAALPGTLHPEGNIL